MQEAVAVSLSGLGSVGADTVRVAVTETRPSESRPSGTRNVLAEAAPAAMAP